MSNLSGGDQVAVLSALRTFQLIDVGGKPTALFQALRDVDVDEFPSALKPLLVAAYPTLFDSSIDLAAATHGELEERFRGFGISGDSIRKATAFFLSLARTAGIPVSPHFKGASRSAGVPRPRVGRRKAGVKAATAMTSEVPPTSTGAEPHDALAERLHRSVYGWIEELPPAGETWHREDFDAWLDTLKSMLQRLYKVS